MLAQLLADIEQLIHMLMKVLVPILIAASVAISLEFLFPRRELRIGFSRWGHSLTLALSGYALTNLALPVTGYFVASLAERNGYGLFNILDVPHWVAVLSGLLILDFALYVLHAWMHKSPLLWRIHRIHHSEVKLDASTSILFHPFEHVFVAAGILCAVFAAGIPPIVLAVNFFAMLAINFWHHANVKALPFQKYLELLIVTPEIHRVHHSSDAAHYDRNFGGVFVIWDRLFKTLHLAPPADASLSFGLKRTEWRYPSTLVSMLCDPFRK